MPDPYAVLGLTPEDATPARVRAAYRRLSKTLHPDAAGPESRGAFEELRAAHDLLLDPARRERYDRTGEWEEAPASNAHAQALTILSSEIDQLLVGLVQRGINAEQLDLIAALRDQLVRREAELLGHGQKVAAAVVTWTRLRPRFRVKKRGSNVLELIAAEKIRLLRQEEAITQEKLTAYRRAGELLADAAFAFDAPSPPPGLQPVGTVFLRFGTTST